VLSNSDSAVSGATGYSGGGLSGPDFIALDGSGNAWITNRMNSVNSISEISHAGIALSPSNGFRAGGLASPYQIAVDGSGDVWVTNSFTTITEFIGAATPVITPLAAGLPVTPTANGTSNLGTRP
jgi:streptogramin lyase